MDLEVPTLDRGGWPPLCTRWATSTTAHNLWVFRAPFLVRPRHEHVSGWPRNSSRTRHSDRPIRNSMSSKAQGGGRSVRQLSPSSGAAPRVAGAERRAIGWSPAAGLPSPLVSAYGLRLEPAGARREPAHESEPTTAGHHLDGARARWSGSYRRDRTPWEPRWNDRLVRLWNRPFSRSSTWRQDDELRARRWSVHVIGWQG